MVDSGKPFACPELGCNQRFVNEDHLDVHRRKHKMSLGLGNFKSLDTPVIADQTPTPTRFLKNCDEVGLFNEPANPFDALFRKASERRNSDCLEPHTSKIGQDTPLDITESVAETEYIPDESVIMERQSQQSVEILPDEDAIVVETIPSDAITVTHVVEVPNGTPATQFVIPAPEEPAAITTIDEDVLGTGHNSVIQTRVLNIHPTTLSMSTSLLLRLPNGQTIPVVPPSVANPSTNVPIARSAVSKAAVVLAAPTQTTPLDSSVVKQKLKNTLLTSQSQGNMGVMTQAVDVVTRQQAQGLQMINLTVGKSTSPNSQARRKRRNSEIDSDMKREKFLERNRAAATRCRNKRKNWINSLEQKADELNDTNTHLSNEVTKLREEVAQLKQLLLAHNDCPVTKQQRQTHGNLITASLQSKSSSPGGTEDNDLAPAPIKLTKCEESIKTEQYQVIRR